MSIAAAKLAVASSVSFFESGSQQLSPGLVHSSVEVHLRESNAGLTSSQCGFVLADV